MALPTDTDLKTMNFIHNGSPFVVIPAKGGLAAATWDSSYQGAPIHVATFSEVDTLKNRMFLIF